ncbi:pyocin knob domain-containing protein [Bacillus paralicheniformis]|nr:MULTISPECIES: pyocin knob domain-containing protein [Bacillus]KUL07015.1 hypothetical protein LI7559_19260 [Bacillus licheniformis LMG 7559]AGN35858.1 putative phage protein XkdV [Bacillus paralicheniformis ATCC 9945a]MCB6217683.1 pyocin knob domain-containing protein [Bacillus paralicheniformis]MCM3423136.1 pyocin knob domain-containing protein [Bacillus paralicheniformis]MCR3890893.1 pyocin knob domain-containing protein [Bacillus paralicheniformis]
MDIQKPRRFETTDRAHADLFNEAIDQLNVNDERIAKRAEEAEEKAKTYTDAHASDHSIHITDKEREKWSAGQLYKLTENNGKVFYRGSSETTDFNTLTETGMYLIYNEGINSPPSSNRIFLLVMSFGNTLVQAAYESYEGKQSYFRFRKSDSTTWTPWQTQETTNGAQAKVDAHERNTNLHVNEDEREKWNNAQLYKITDSNGTRTKLPDGTDLLTLPTGFYYAMGHVVQNNPVENDDSWFNYDVIETGAGRKTIQAWRSYDNSLWLGTIHTDGIFKGWKKVMTVEDFNKRTYVDTYDHEHSSVSASENIPTKLVFGVTRADHLEEYNISNSEITLKNSGLYLIRLYVTSKNITVNSENILSCYVGGKEYQRLGTWYPATTDNTCVLFLQQKFAAGDKVTFYITPRNTGKAITIATAYVTMSQIG